MSPSNERAEIERTIHTLEWPRDPSSMTRILASELARLLGASIEWISFVALFHSAPDAAESFTEVFTIKGRIATVEASGISPEAAHRDGQFFALRKALLGERAICGSLLDLGGIRAILEPTEDPDEYRLIISRAPSTLPRRQRTGRALRRTGTPYILRVRLDPRAKNGRTRYLRVTGLRQYPELQAFLRPKLRSVKATIRLHRLIMALAGHDMRDGQVHAHHINGIGYDCRIENLLATHEKEHRRYHGHWSSDLHDPEAIRYICRDGDPFEVSGRWDQARFHEEQKVMLGRHAWNRHGLSDFVELVPLKAARRDRRRSLDRVIIHLLLRHGETSMKDLIHALSGTSCGSTSGVRNVVNAAEVLGVVERFRRGRGQYIRLTTPLTRAFRIKRVVSRRADVIRHLDLQSRLRTTSRWFRAPFRFGALSRALRRVFVPRARACVKTR